MVLKYFVAKQSNYDFLRKKKFYSYHLFDSNLNEITIDLICKETGFDEETILLKIKKVLFQYVNYESYLLELNFIVFCNSLVCNVV